MARDYAREYAQRVAKERARAQAEDRAYDPQRARGHGQGAEGRARENELGRLRRAEAASRYSKDPARWRVMVDQLVGWWGLERAIEHLKGITANGEEFEALAKKLSPRASKGRRGNSPAAQASQGWRDYYGLYMKQYAYMPVELWWYHGWID